MPIHRVTLTGVDSVTDIPRLNALYERYPFIEIGLLISQTRGGTPRYPAPEVLASLIDGLTAPLAIHVCGRAVQSLMRQDSDDLVVRTTAHPRIGRIQINAPIASLVPLEAALDQALETLAKPVILQDNDENHDRLDRITASNVAILFDRSGGNGHRPMSWPSVRPERPCAYAGGLTPERIGRDLIDIERAAGGQNVGIDLESGLRIDNVFCPARAEVICQAVEEHTTHGKAEIARTVTADQVLDWIAKRPGASWVSTADDVREAIAAIVNGTTP